MAGGGPVPLEHVGLVKVIAPEYRGLGLDLEDLVQEGLLGLLRACERYDGRGGTPFPAYAVLVIRRAIADATIAQAFPIRVPSHLHRLRRELRRRGGAARPSRARRELLAAAEPHWRPGGWQEPEPGTPGTPLAELAVAPAEERADPWELDRLRAALAELPVRERRVIGLRYGLDGRPPLLLRQAAAALDSTKQRIHQIERQALRRLRLALDVVADTTG